MKKLLFALVMVFILLTQLTACKNGIKTAVEDRETLNEETQTYAETIQSQETQLSTESISCEETQLATEPYQDIDGNPYTFHEVWGDETYVYWDYDEVYESLDLSEYSDWGPFQEDGIMWVEKSDYTGKQFGYIDYNGNIIIPLTNEIVYAENFRNGLAIIWYKRDGMNNGSCAIINTAGEIVAKFDAHATTERAFLNNGNIYFTYIDVPMEEKNSFNIGDLQIIQINQYNGAYMFCKNSSEFVQMPSPAWDSISRINYSDGLMLVYSNYYLDHGAKYYDTDGNCIIDLYNSNEYYREVMYADDFINGEANVTFVGMDGNWYTVKIDNTGKWINEPEQISKYDASTFSDSY